MIEGGVLPSQTIRKFISKGLIKSKTKIHPSQIQPATLDVRVGENVWRVPASFLLEKGRTMKEKLEEFNSGSYRLDISKKTFLESGKTYVIELQEELNLPKNVGARSNPKSSTGRLDVFVRLLTENGESFEQVPYGYKGKLYLTIYSMSFDLIIIKGVALNQLRFYMGENFVLSTNELKLLYQHEALLFDKKENPIMLYDTNLKEDGIFLTIDLDEDIIGYRAKKNAQPIDLTKKRYYDKEHFWEPILKPQNRSLILDPHYFYIFKSKEKIRIPLGYSCEMVPFHSGIGEFRSHYAGFFDPGFGYGRGEIKGSHAVLEIRMRDVPMEVFDGQIIVKMIFERNIEEPDVVYGDSKLKTNYQGQSLRLGKHFT